MEGTVTLSVEIELGWGMHDTATYSHLSSNGLKEREALRRLLDLCDRYQVPISFDVVGHLLEDTCEGQHDGDYPQGWWAEDPGTDYNEDPLFYAPDIVEEIRSRETDHEICTHTYSHIIAGECSKDTLRTELSKVMEAHQQSGLPNPESIVFPRHSAGDYRVLREYGITTVRRPIKGYGGNDSNPITKLWRHLTADHPVSRIISTKGITETTCTPHPSLTGITLPQGQQSHAPHWSYRIAPIQVRMRQHRKYLISAFDRAVKQGEHIHLWTHLHNMSNQIQWEGIRSGLAHLGEYVTTGDVQVQTMNKLRVKK